MIEKLPDLRFLSELYKADAPDARLLAEYPSSNSDGTIFENKTRFIIHDPFPPPPPELLKVLGPHHLMCGWGSDVVVTSQISPPRNLLEHWQRLLGADGVPDWQPFDDAEKDKQFITLFPHESLSAQQQVIPPETNYELHSKEVIEKIDCSQANVLDSIEPPCIVKLSHGYAGLGNFIVQSQSDVVAMRKQLDQHWPTAVLVANSIIEDITGDFGVQFYLRRDGSVVWLGFTQQNFTDKNKWCGGTFSADMQGQLFDELSKIVEPTGQYLASQGYFGLVGIDILRNAANEFFLVDVNPRLTGVTPFLMASRIFAQDGLGEGVYLASQRFSGSYDQLIEKAESFSDAKVIVVSAFEAADDKPTICHLAVTSKSQPRNQSILSEMGIE